MPKHMQDGSTQTYDKSKGKYVPTQKLVLEKKLGRALKPDEIAHHKDHVKRHNNPGNLTVMKRGDHNKVHDRNGGRKKG